MAPVAASANRPVISRAVLSRAVRRTRRVPVILRRPKALPIQLITVSGVVAMCLALVHAYDRCTPRILPQHRQSRMS